MKLIESSYQIIEPTGYTIDDIYKSIELAGKVSHKSEHTIKEGSAKEFVDRMIKLGHGATLEFGTVYLYAEYKYPDFGKIIDRYINNEYSKCNYFPTFHSRAYISSNLRVLVENDWLDDLKYLCKPTEFHEKRVCVKFILPIGISREFCRHRTFSFMEMSTRYVNMSGNKMGNEITFIGSKSKPDFMHSPQYLEWIKALENAEKSYNNLIEMGYKPQEARGVLPLDTKTELYMCGFLSDWENFFSLRDDKQHAHPQAYELAHPLHEEFIKRGYIK